MGRGPRRARLPRHLSGHRALPARPLPHHVRQPALDRAPICRLLHGRGFERLLPPQPRGRPEGPLGRLRPRHPSRLRFRPSARLGRCGHGGCRHRFHLRHAHPVRRHSARPDERVDDHERRGAAGARALHRRGGGTGRAGPKTLRHDPERHSQRVHGAQHLYLPAERVDAHHLRHLRLYLGATCRSSTRSRSPATTCRKRARRRISSSPIRSPTASSISAPASPRG